MPDQQAKHRDYFKTEALKKDLKGRYPKHYWPEDPMTAIQNLAPRAFTNHFRDDRIEFQRWGFKLVGAAVGEGDIDMRRAYEIFRDHSCMQRINIETELETPLDDMQAALTMEVDAIRRSVRYCREELGIQRS